MKDADGKKQRGKDKRTERQRDRETDRQTDTQTDRQRQTEMKNNIDREREGRERQREVTATSPQVLCSRCAVAFLAFSQRSRELKVASGVRVVAELQD